MSTMEKENLPRARRSFTPEFKADAVSMVLDDGRKIVDVADVIVRLPDYWLGGVAAVVVASEVPVGRL